jgi:hypothetical protein
VPRAFAPSVHKATAGLALDGSPDFAEVPGYDPFMYLSLPWSLPTPFVEDCIANKYK